MGIYSNPWEFIGVYIKYAIQCIKKRSFIDAFFIHKRSCVCIFFYTPPYKFPWGAHVHMSCGACADLGSCL